MSSIKYNEEQILHHLKHYLPAQSALKDFVHHNTLHAFQDRKFFKALYEAKSIFGYKTALSIQDFRALYKNEKIDHQILLKVITDSKGKANVDEWLHLLLDAGVDDVYKGRIGQLRGQWKKQFSIDLDLEIQPFLFRFLCSYLDQGISIWRFPVWNKGFLTTIREIERNTYTSFFKTSRAKDLLMKRHLEISDLLHILAGDEALYEQYLFDQQFSHPGWSGIVSAIEDNPKNLLDVRKITLKELIIFELLLEIDTLDDKFGETWIPLGLRMTEQLHPLFKLDKKPLYFELIELWQDAYEWSYYDQVLAGIKKANSDVKGNPKSLQALFCIDDREGSFRRHVEDIDPSAQTFGTPGFFGVEFYYKPKDSKFAMKVCPAPMNPKYLIKEQSKRKKNKKDFHFANYTHSLFFGWLITHTIGFVSAFRLFINIFIPR
ncbi:MAG TPA: Na-translocating system protein MpsB, partial [Saprospiraceae bacterium]|nr:Na-translocating system protein MpsB [Saprospiraceae bacterium]